MLSSLYIENAAVIKRLELDPSPGFTVLTGETGSGKSVIIDCLSFLLGRRNIRELVRSGEEKAVISAVFTELTSADIKALEEAGIEDPGNELIVSRTLSCDGKSQARVNSRPVTQKQLADIGKILVSLHSQDDTATLESPDVRLSVLDSAAADKNLLDEYYSSYEKYTALCRRLDSLEKSEGEKEQLRDILAFQIKELETASLKAGEDEELEDEKRRIEGSEKVRKCTQSALRCLSYNEKGITAPYLAAHAADALEKLTQVFPEYSALCERLRSCRYELEDISSEIDKLAEENGLQDNPEKRLDEINSRLEIINKLKRKYGGDICSVLAFLEKSRSRMNDIENSDELKAELQKAIKSEKNVLDSAALKLSDARRKTADSVTGEMLSVLEYLDMPKVRFEIRLSKLDTPLRNGYDRADFMLAANPGEPLLPIEKCASGGELSRVMLALRCSLNTGAGSGTLVFDEIDTGISGSTSRKIGLKLRSVSKNSQVISVTHSAQIASLADSHLKISKAEEQGRTCSVLTVLDRDGRIDELSRILGGISVTDAQRQAAVDMLDSDSE